MTMGGATGSVPVVSGPLPGRSVTVGGAFDLEGLGYLEEEFFVAGVGRSFRMAGPRGSDGAWAVETAATAPFTTRLLVRRPADPARFNGTVLVEWLNVSAGADGSPEWSFAHRHLVREGFAWVGVSAQRAGIDGGGLVEGLHLKKADPERYAPLDHPGDAFAYDIFTQAGRVLRTPNGASPLAPLGPQRLVAAGESQSAAFLVTYINAIDPLDPVYQGFLVHGRGGSGAGLAGFGTEEPEGGAAPGGPDRSAIRRAGERIRADVRVPVLTVQSETDVVALGGWLARQPDADRHRLWEIAGSAHGDTYLLVAAAQDSGSLEPAALAELLRPTTETFVGTTDLPVNAGPQQHYVLQAAISHLERWIRDGTAPPTADRLELLEGGAGLVPDEHGIAKGGVRTPWVDVPTARLSGLGQTGAGFAFLFGTTEPFDPRELARAYPGGKGEYLERFARSLADAVEAGFLLAADVAEIEAIAAAGFDERS